ncbi:unnamed protein product [Didymodactylos carnosus]|uniref:Uncharacterized protein n=1 Tax=Didymodactylos carnosus TaxID=1234261 RepID=A0A814Q5Z4_9BILA|nr:unnamed protein product [Didymodactylos carnosus]CAF1142942.1 unnamed protein product [Didymodactylos carnosus]CAF3879824.1 unnamed protein product [Didymodactylos carnosus]CAF3941075.1 unnamed protein product [Didymodactylos carnosus]
MIWNDCDNDSTILHPWQVLMIVTTNDYHTTDTINKVYRFDKSVYKKLINPPQNLIGNLFNKQRIENTYDELHKI